MRNIRLAMVQSASLLQQVSFNIGHAIASMEQASRKGADLIVFPELYTTGYDMKCIGTAYELLGETVEENTVQAFAAAARSCQMNVVISMPLKTGAGLYNSAAIIDRQGRIAGDYGKTHLWAEEKRFFAPGNEYPVYELDLGKLGVMICYDAGFPEVARMLALQGAELIVTPAAFAMVHKRRWDIYFQARALENSCFVAGINGVGGALEPLFGNNKLFGPEGNLIMEGTLHQEEMQIVELDLAQVTVCRENYSYLSQLRMDTYFAYQSPKKFIQ